MAEVVVVAEIAAAAAVAAVVAAYASAFADDVAACSEVAFVAVAAAEDLV